MIIDRNTLREQLVAGTHDLPGGNVNLPKATVIGLIDDIDGHQVRWQSDAKQIAEQRDEIQRLLHDGPLWMQFGLGKLHAMVDLTDPNDVIGTALTHAGFERVPVATVNGTADAIGHEVLTLRAEVQRLRGLAARFETERHETAKALIEMTTARDELVVIATRLAGLECDSAAEERIEQLGKVGKK